MEKKNMENERFCVTRQELTGLLGCGLYTADRISRKAEARIYVGGRVLIYLPKIRKYLDRQAEK